jgi:hypothetical protein
MKSNQNPSIQGGPDSDFSCIIDENNELREQLQQQKALVSKLTEALDSKEKEIVQFVMTGGSLGGEVRDRVIKTLQEQLLVREEEIQFYRANRLDTQEEQKKGERLLISAIHSIGLQYHEEMVRRFQESPPSIVNEDSSGLNTPV